MKKYRVTVGVAREEDISKQWFISLPAATPSGISRAIRRLAGKKYVREMVEKVER